MLPLPSTPCRVSPTVLRLLRLLSLLLVVLLVQVDSPVGLHQQVLLVSQAQPVAQAGVQVWQPLCVDLQALMVGRRGMNVRSTPCCWQWLWSATIGRVVGSEWGEVASRDF